MSLGAASSSALPAHAEVVIVGAGALGSATAFHLAGLGRDVLHLERGPLASETSSQGAGFLASIRPRRSSAEIVRYSSEFYTRFREETGFDVDLHLVGGVRVALTEAWLDELRVEAATGREMGLEVDELTGAEVRERMPLFELGAAVGGTFTPLEGYMTATREAAIGLACGAERRGATLRTYEDVTDVRATSGNWEVTTTSGRVRAEHVVLATNAWLRPLLRRLDIPFAAYPIQHQCAVYDLPTVVDAALPTLRIGERDIYLRHEVGGLMIGGVGDEPFGPSPSAPDEAFDLASVRPDREVYEAARRRAIPFVPGLAGAPVIREQRGLCTVAPDLEPMLGPLAPGLWVATADLRGIQSGPGLGLMLAQLIATGGSEWDAAPYRPDRFGDLADDPERVRDAAAEGIRPKFAPAGTGR
jgi:glycine/D-amino acid oxidase-like deaminating enzyme